MSQSPPTPEDQGQAKPPRSPRALLRTILMLDDTPHSIALGTAIGMFFGMTPTVGIQMILVLTFAFLMRPFFKFNKVAGVLTVYVTNPLTVVPIYWACYKIGTYFVAGHVTYEKFSGILEYKGYEEWSRTVRSLVFDVGAPLLVGCLLVATVSALLTYPTMIWLIRQVRRRQAEAAGQTDAPETGSDDPTA